MNGDFDRRLVLNRLLLKEKDQVDCSTQSLITTYYIFGVKYPI